MAIVLCVLAAFGFADRMAGHAAAAKSLNTSSLGRLLIADASIANTYTVLYSFCSQANCADGDQPFGGLVEDASGNFYGTTYLGGSDSGVCFPYGCGTAFKLDASGNYTILHDFCSQASRADASGNLYGATEYACGGGSGSAGGGNATGGGTPAGTYTVTVIGTASSLSNATTLTLVVQ